MRFCVLKMISVAFCIFVSSVYATEATRLSIANNTNLLKSISRILVEKNSRTVAQRKISSHLLKTKEDLKVGVKQFQNKTNSVPSFVVNSLGVTYCKVVIRAEVTDSLVKKLQSHGAVDIKTHPRWKTISCRIPADEMEKIAEDSSVYSIREQTRPILNKANTSEGVSAHQIDKAVSKFGVTGKGIKIGVISDSVRYLENVQASGDLPNVTVLPGQDGAIYSETTGERLDTGEGTAMLEIVHDVAPDAELYFATAEPTEAQFADNILGLCEAGCNIIVDDVTYPFEPAFQDGIIAQAVNEVRSKGCLYFSSAGNSGNKKIETSGTYEGDFVSLGSATINGIDYEWNSFGGNDCNRLLCRGAPHLITLQWSDPWDGASADYDLFLFDSEDSSIVVSSCDVQDGGTSSAPIEWFSCPGGGACNLLGLVVLKRKNSPNRYLRLNTHRGRLACSTTGSAYGHNAAESAVCVGAASALNGVFTSSSTMEDYSSDGPRRIFYNPDGSAITPGNFSSTGGKLLKKVDITAGDRVSCATPGFNPFPGTSAAAPHAAAIAALMLSARPDLTQEQIVEIMGSTSWRLNGHNTPVDELSGRGIINALAAMEATKPYLNITESEVNVSAEGGTSSVRVESNGSFNLSADKDWILIQNASGNGTKEVKFEVLRNSSASGRKGTIKISNDYGNECILFVSQAGMTAPARPVVIASDGTSSESITVEWGNCARALSYSLERSESVSGDKTLLNANATSPYVDRNVIPGKTYYYWVTAVNEVGENESSNDSGYRSIALNLDATGNVYTKDGGESSFSVSGNSSWTVSCADDWISLETTSGSGSGEVSFTIDKNYDGEARYGTILVTSGSVSKTITVTQPGRVLVVVNSGTVTINTGTSSPSFNVSSSGKTYYGKVVDGTAVYSFDYLEIGSSVSVSISGTRPLVIESETDMKIACDLDVSGTSSGRCGGGIGGAGGSGGASVSGGSGGSGGSYGWGGNGWIIDNYAGETQGQSGSSGSAGSTGYGGSAGKSGTSGSTGGKGFGSTGSAASGGSRGSGGSAGSAASSVGRAGSGGYAGSEGNAGGSGTKGGAGTAGNNGSSGSNGVNAFTTALTSDVIIAGSGGGGGGGGGSGGSGGGGSGGGGGGGGGGTTEAQARAYSSNKVYIDRKQYQGAMGGIGGGGGSGGKGASSGAGGAGGVGGHGGGVVVLKAAGVLQLSGCVDVSAANGSRNGSSGSSASSASYGGSGGLGSTGLSAMTTTGYTYLSPSSGCRGGNGGAGGNGGSGGKGGSGGTGGYGSPGMVKLYASVLLASNGSIAGANGDNSTTASRCGGLSLGTNMKPTALTSQKPTVPTTIKCGEMGGAVSSKTASVYDESVMVPVVGQLKTLHADVAGICETGNYALSQVSSIAAEGSVEGLTVKRLTTLFDGYDQIFLINNSSTKVGPVEAEISGVACEIPELDAGEAWTTCVPTGVSVTGSEALIVSHSSIAAEASGVSGMVSVTANCGWTASKNVSWITVSPTSGSGNGTISYTIAANTTVQSRSGTITVTSSGGITRIIAVSQEGLPMYEVVFNTNGGTLSGGAIRNIVSGAEIGTLPTPTRDGYTFLGWFTAAEGGEQVTESTVVTGDVTYYAQWEEEVLEPIFTIDENGVLTSVKLNGATEFVVPDNVLVIGEMAFSGCSSLVSVTIPDSVTSIDRYAFKGCSSLTSLTIPNSVTSIGYSAFLGCSSLTSIIIPNSVYDVGSALFYGCTSLKYVEVPATLHPGLLSIWDDRYWFDSDVPDVDKNYYAIVTFNSNDETITLSEHKVFLEICYSDVDWAEWTYLEGTVGELPVLTRDGDTFLGWFTAEEGGELVTADTVIATDITLYPRWESASKIKWTIDESGVLTSVELNGETVAVIPDGVTSIGSRVFSDCSSLASVRIPDSVVSIKSEAFYGCSSLTSVTIPDGITSIEDYTFCDCSSLTSITIPDSVTSIGSGAFKDCSSLTSVRIPDGVTSIGEYAFYECSSLSGVKIPDSVTSIGSMAFEGCNDLLYDRETILNVILVDGWVIGYEDALSGDLNLTGIRGIAPYAFYDCSSLTSVIIPDSVTNIEDSAFRGCVGLADEHGFVIVKDRLYDYCGDGGYVTIPNEVVSIGSYSFYGCDLLEGVTIPNSVTHIGANAFSGTALREVVVPMSVIKHEIPVFAECYLLQKAFIPVSLKEQVEKWNDNWGEFAYCSGDLEVTYYDTIISLNYNGAIGQMPNLYVLDGASIGDLPEPTRDGYKFIGWFTAAEGGEQVTESTVVTGDVTYYAQWEVASKIKWTIDENGVLTSVELNGETFVVIPDGVTSIGERAFLNCSSLTSVEIPNSVTNIGDYAFANCYNLTSVMIPSSIMGVGDHAFSGCYSLISIIIPEGVSYIGDWAFANCSSLDRVVIPSSVTDIGAYAFYFCTSLTTIVIPDGVMRIGGWAFHYCQLITHVTIPGSVRSIGTGAFDHCESLTSVTMLDGVTTIGDQVFADCSSLMSVTIPRSVTSIGMGVFSRSFSGLHIVVDEENASYKLLDGFLFSKDGSVLHSYVGGLSSITIPEGVTNIGDGAFFSCATLASVTIPNSVTNVGDHAFFECGSLTSVIIPTSVTSIGEYAFYNCDSLKEITIPNSVTSIGEYAFFSCSSLTSVVIPGSVKRIPDSAFALCARVKNVKIEEGVIEIGDGAFYQVGYNSDRYDGVELFERLILPKSVNKIGDQAFSFAGIKYVEGLDETDEIHENAFINTPYATGEWYAPVLRIENDVVTGIDWEYRSDDGCITNYVLHIPDGITAIGDNAFQCFDRFSNIRLPESLRDIGNGAFESCYNMEEINIPEGVSNINDWTFGQCSRLVEVKLPSTVTNIGQYAFSYCHSLRNINIPEQVVSIGEDAFYDCDSLSNIVFPNTLEYIGDYAFDDCNSLSEVVIPSSIKHIGVDAFGYYYSEHHYLKRITIPQALCESNEDNSWFCLRDIGCYGITNLVIESGVTNIGEDVFSYLCNLQSVTIPEGVVNIDDFAFGCCCSLLSVTLPSTVTNIGAVAFSSCFALESIVIPESVVTIGECAFICCENLKYAKVPLALKEQVELGEVFADCSSDLQIEYYGNTPLVSPVIMPADGTEFYEDSCMVTISCETEGATIYYTTDGTTPRPRPANLYTEPFEIADTTTVKAIAVKGDEHTELVSATIVKKEIVLAAPVITPADGTEFYEDSCTVTISCATEVALIYYTTDGTTPRPRPANLYTEPFEITGSVTVKAIAVLGIAHTDVVSATFIKRELTLPIAVDAPTLEFTTGGDAQWLPVRDTSAKIGGVFAQSGVITASENYPELTETWMETSVSGSGTFSFWWKVDCEYDYGGNCTFDRLEVYTNGVEVARIDGKTEWAKMEFTFADSGTHTIRWRFCKDDWDDDKLTDLAWVDGVVWTPASTDITVDVGDGKSVVVPTEWIDRYEGIVSDADGDKAAALQQTAANGRKVWECFILGIDPTKADDDFKITRFWMEGGKPMFEFSHSTDGAGNSFMPRLKVKGKAALSDGWSDVPEGGNLAFRFFTVEVELP